MSRPWPTIPIGEIAEVARGGSPRPIKNFITDSADGVNWIKIGDTEKGGRYIERTAEKIKREGIKRSRWVEEGDFLLSNSMSFGRPYILRTSGCIHDGWLVLSPDYERVDQDYLYFVLSAPSTFAQFDKAAAGSTVRNLNIGLVSKVTIPLPPLEEQKRIVAVLDQAFAALDRAHALAEANLADAEELFARKLSSAFAEAGKSAAPRPFEQLCKALTPKTKIKRKDYLAEGAYPIVSQEADLISGFWDEPSALMGLEEPIVVFGDHTRCLKYIDFDFVVGADGTKVLKPSPGVNALYLYYGLRSIPIAEKGYARHFRFLKEASLPDLDEAKQEQLATSLSAIEEEASHLMKVYEAKLDEIDDLRQSLLQKAFVGALT